MNNKITELLPTLSRFKEQRSSILWGALIVALLAAGLFGSIPSPKVEAQGPTPQLAKEYIHAGSRTLAVEDYGITPPNPTPTP